MVTNYDGRSFCGRVGEPGEFGASMAKWNHDAITWSIIADLPQISRESFRGAMTKAFARWSAVCGISPVEVAGPSANIVVGIQTQAPGGVLADCQLPFPGITRNHSLRMRVDTAERWAISDNAPPDRIDLVRVLAHEIGHGLGLNHGPTGALMAPTYSVRIIEPTAWDINEVRARYGNPKPPVPPAPSPLPTPNPTPEGDAILCEILRRGGRFFVRSTRTGGELEL